MLVRTFQVEIGRRARIGPPLEGEGVGRAGVEPDVEDVLDLLVVGGIAARPEELGGLLGEPGVCACLLDRRDDAGVDVLVAQRLAGPLVHEHGERGAPGALA